jgi:hypothetical protein
VQARTFGKKPRGGKSIGLRILLFLVGGFGRLSLFLSRLDIFGLSFFEFTQAPAERAGQFGQFFADGGVSP